MLGWKERKEGEGENRKKKQSFLINSSPHNQKPAVSTSVLRSSPAFYCKKVIQKLLIVENRLE